MSWSHSSIRRSAGFTLVELTLVIATIAILSAIAIPRYADAMSRYRVDLAAKRLVADLALARSAARASSAGQVVNFATPANGYTFTGLPSPHGRPGDYAVSLADEPYKVSLGSLALGDGTATSIRFTRYGTPELGGSVVISAGGFKKTVQIDPITGRAEVK